MEIGKRNIIVNIYYVIIDIILRRIEKVWCFLSFTQLVERLLKNLEKHVMHSGVKVMLP